jgi:hypothetical protein
LVIEVPLLFLKQELYHASTPLIDTLPPTLLQATIDRYSPNQITLTGTGLETTPLSAPAPTTTFSEAIQQHQTTSEGWCVELVQGSLSNPTNNLHAFAMNRLCIVSNGS